MRQYYLEIGDWSANAIIAEALAVAFPPPQKRGNDAPLDGLSKGSDREPCPWPIPFSPLCPVAAAHSFSCQRIISEPFSLEFAAQDVHLSSLTNVL